MTHIFHSGQPNHGGDLKTFEVTISTYPRGTLGSIVSFLVATLYQGIIPDRNHKPWNIVSTPYAGAAGMLLHINGKFAMEKLKSSLLS